MDSKTYITLDLQAPNIAIVAAGKQNDRASRVIVAQLRDGETLWTPPAGVAAMIRYAKPDNTAGFYDVLEDGSAAYSIDGSVITFTLVEQALTVPGSVYVEINFYTETEKLTTFYFLLDVQRSVLTDATIISSDYFNVLSQQIQALLGATANPPYIDPTTKNWMIWDENAGGYVDSGFSSVGLTGPVFTPSVSAAGVISWTNNGGLPNPTSRNITGPQGVSITGTERVSGTGAPGTTDEYNVNLSDGTVGGTFNVYNGSDGQGSPGTSTPLTDSGSGVVGTATAYSRQDHRHPLNVSSGTPAKDGTGSAGSGSAYARNDHIHPLNVDTTNPAPLGTAAPGSAATYARRDHIHAMPSAEQVGAMSTWELLWTNASPGSAFADQTISIDLSGYDQIQIWFRPEASDPDKFFAFAKVGSSIRMAFPRYTIERRKVNVTTTGVQFYPAYYLTTYGGSSESLLNTYMVPVRIYGIKGVNS